jgi:hypothetical protein
MFAKNYRSEEGRKNKLCGIMKLIVESVVVLSPSEHAVRKSGEKWTNLL